MTIADLLINWYKDNKRDLPWRNTTDPYKIWLSEIILQQTRVNQGLPYYNNFITKYPSIHELANASEEEVMKTWQGLGYYSRARNLHATAKIVSYELNGVFPTSYKDIINLKGVGHYTAAAISSFAYKQVIPVIDGNVYRVLSRLYWIETPINSTQSLKVFEPIARDCISTNQPDIYNQAIMELGALICTPKSPLCNKCPLNAKCAAFDKKETDLLPIKLKTKKSRDRFFNYLAFIHQEKTILQKRENSDIWQGLYEFPLLESTKEINIEQVEKYLKKEYPNLNIGTIELIKQPKHILSHQNIYSFYWVININAINREKNLTWIDLPETKRYPVSKNIERFLNTNSVFL